MKVAIFDWGGTCIHPYYLAEQLSNNGILIDIYLFIPVYKSDHLNTFLARFEHKNINVIQIRCTRFEEKLMKLNKVAEFFRYQVAAVCINLFLPYRTRKLFTSADYKNIITISQFSLYWLYKTDRDSISKTIHYSLEIEKKTDPVIRKHSKHFALIEKEFLLLKKIKGLIIQDRFRLQAFMESGVRKNLEIFFIPVSIPGDIIRTKSNYLYEKYKLAAEKKVILYFGAVYKERKIDQLIAAFADIHNPDWTLVLQGGGMKFPFTGTLNNVKTSDTSLAYHNLHILISSATIGIALYDNNWPNTRLTAFSSEKIARYLQAGVPFIAFKNESYVALKGEFDCCELIENLADLEKAIRTILDNYNFYRENCYRAYNKYYNIRNNVKELTDFLLNKTQDKLPEKI